MSPQGQLASLRIDASTAQAIATLKIKVRRVVEGLQGGSHISPHFGASVEFAAHKRYAPGDDFRHIDWKALARTDRYFVKQHQREVVLRCLLVLDCSASMNYRGTRAWSSKLDYAVVLLAAISHILMRQGDAPGLLTFDDVPRDFILPNRHAGHLPNLMAKFATAKAAVGGGTGLMQAISRAAEGAGRRSMVIFASDLWGATRETELALAHLSARGHNIVVFHVLDPDELDLPFDRSCVFQGLEGETAIEGEPALIREDYRREVAAVREHWRRICGEAGIDLQATVTHAPPEHVLASFAASRYRRER